jgi:hypothetical protein
MRIASAFLWGMVGLIVGAIEMGTIGWATGFLSVERSVQIGAVLGLIIGLIYGFRTRAPEPASPDSGRAKVLFEPCAWCEGSGWEGKKKKRQCETCEGDGRVVVPVPPQKCSQCKGKGRSFLGRKCKACAGAGWENYSLMSPIPTPAAKPTAATSSAPRRRLFPRTR